MFILRDFLNLKLNVFLPNTSWNVNPKICKQSFLIISVGTIWSIICVCVHGDTYMLRPCVRKPVSAYIVCGGVVRLRRSPLLNRCLFLSLHRWTRPFVPLRTQSRSNNISYFLQFPFPVTRRSCCKRYIWCDTGPCLICGKLRSWQWTLSTSWGLSGFVFNPCTYAS
jgi:hypothetical protein